MNTSGAKESFSVWKLKIENFVRAFWPQLALDDFKIQHGEGGAYNRIVGIDILEPSSGMLEHPNGRRKIDELILRVPHDTEALTMPYDVTILKYIRSIVKVPTPEVIASLVTSENPLGRPFMIQNRLDGSPLNMLLKGLNLAQKKSAIEGYGKIMRDLYELTSECAGIPSLRNDSASLAKSPILLEEMIVPVGHFGFKPTAEQPRPPMGKLASRQTPREFLLSLCDRQNEHEKSKWNAPIRYPYDRAWDDLAYIVEQMYRMGFLPDDEQFHLIHGDLFPRNILVRLTSSTSVEITGVVDWDMAHFGPRFMATAPPLFFWNGGHEVVRLDVVHEYERTPTWTELKETWDNAMGEEFCKMAYSTEYVILREIYLIMIWGFSGNSKTSVERVESLVDQVIELKRRNK